MGILQDEWGKAEQIKKALKERRKNKFLKISVVFIISVILVAILVAIFLYNKECLNHPMKEDLKVVRATDSKEVWQERIDALNFEEDHYCDDHKAELGQKVASILESDSTVSHEGYAFTKDEIYLKLKYNYFTILKIENNGQKITYLELKRRN